MYQFKLAASSREIDDYFALRRTIFVEEQQIFENDDRDDIDHSAYPIVAIAPNHQVIGVVRIYEVEPGVWYGGRLGTHANHRKGWKIGKGLIHKAVTTANMWGCHQFLATVQMQNVRFFQRFHWQSLEERLICDRLHHLMEADLKFYPASPDMGSRVLLRSQEAS